MKCAGIPLCVIFPAGLAGVHKMLLFPCGILPDDFDGNLDRQCWSNTMVSGTLHLYGGVLKPHPKSSNSETRRKIRDTLAQLGVKE